MQFSNKKKKLILQLYGGLTATEFKIRHECWKQEAKRLLIDGNFTSYKYLSIIIKVRFSLLRNIT